MDWQTFIEQFCNCNSREEISALYLKLTQQIWNLDISEEERIELITDMDDISEVVERAIFDLKQLKSSVSDLIADITASQQVKRQLA